MGEKRKKGLLSSSGKKQERKTVAGRKGGEGPARSGET